MVPPDAADFLQAQVHRCAAREQAHARDLARRRVGIGFRVALLDADEQQDAVLDGAHAVVLDHDLGPPHALHERDHAGELTSVF